MFDDSHILKDTDLEKLRSELKDCKKQLLDLMDEWDKLNYDLQPRLLFTYNNLFGNIEDELNTKNSINSKLERKVELLTIKASRGEQITQTTLEFIDKLIEREYEKKEHSHRYRFTVKPSQEIMDRLTAIGRIQNDSNNNLSYLYRAIVKKLHPDMEGQSDLFRRYWNSVIDAYKSKDIGKLKIFHKLICEDESYYYEEEGDLRQKLQKEIFDLKIHIQAESRKLSRTQNDEPFSFADKLDDPRWINSRKKKLKEKLSSIQVQISENKKIITAFKNNDMSALDNKDSQSEFQSEFFDNTYAKR